MLDDARVSPIDATSPETAAAGLGRHADLWSGSGVVGVGWTARTARELHTVAHGLIRVLVEQMGFRSLHVEGDHAASEALDTFVRTGAGDPQRTLASARSFLATREMLDLVLWLRDANVRDPTRRVRIVHGGADDMSSPAALERSIAATVVAWHERHGDGIVYLGGAYHTAVDTARVSPLVPGGPVPTAGSLLRDRFGARYRSVGLTFGSGTIPQPVPPPMPTSLDARLDGLGHPTALVDARELQSRRWRTGVDRLRAVGPGYDAREDDRHAMLGVPADWFDVIVHQRTATSVTFLT